MSKMWYPVIDYVKCAECGACVDMCPHGVYDKEKAPTPVVINPEVCIQGCHGCQNKCPTEAIEYVGDSKENDSESCDCGCSCGDDSGGCCK